MSSLILSHFSSCRFVSLIFSRPQQTKRSFKASYWNTKQRSTNGTPSAGIPMFHESRRDDFKKMWVTDMRTSNLLPQPFRQTKWKLYRIPQNERHHCITCRTCRLWIFWNKHWHLNTLLKPQLYKGKKHLCIHAREVYSFCSSTL